MTGIWKTLATATSAWCLMCGISLAQGLAQKSYKPLPDAEITKAGRFTAWLIDPTTRYAHGVLGDQIEAGGFAVERDGKQLVYRLPPDAVFEDRRVRLADLDADGIPEAIIVKSYLHRGAAIAVFRISSNKIEPVAESEAIGQSNRWLNPVGIADFMGTGHLMVAAVVTPHLAGSLSIYSLTGNSLKEAARIDGYTNHIIGSRDLDLAAVVKMRPNQPPLIVIPTIDRRRLAAISLQQRTLEVVKTWPIGGLIQSVRVDFRFRATVSTASGTEIVDLGKN